MSDLSFSKQKRIKKRSEYLAIQGTGKKWHTQHFVACYRNSQEMCRLGVTITKKVDKCAVKRNLLRRRIKEIFRINYPKFSKTLDLVVIAKEGATLLDFSNLQKELYYLFKKIGLSSVGAK